MKSAEEWALEFHAPAHSAIYITNKIKSIQSDAHKQGVIDGIKKAMFECSQREYADAVYRDLHILATKIESGEVEG